MIDCEYLRTLIINNDLKTAFEDLISKTVNNLKDDLILLYSQLNDWTSEKEKGHDPPKEEKNRIKYALLKIITEIELYHTENPPLKILTRIELEKKLTEAYTIHTKLKDIKTVNEFIKNRRHNINVRYKLNRLKKEELEAIKKKFDKRIARLEKRYEKVLIGNFIIVFMIAILILYIVHTDIFELLERDISNEVEDDNSGFHSNYDSNDNHHSYNHHNHNHDHDHDHDHDD